MEGRCEVFKIPGDFGGARCVSRYMQVTASCNGEAPRDRAKSQRSYMSLVRNSFGQVKVQPYKGQKNLFLLIMFIAVFTYFHMKDCSRARQGEIDLSLFLQLNRLDVQ